MHLADLVGGIEWVVLLCITYAGAGVDVRLFFLLTLA